MRAGGGGPAAPVLDMHGATVHLLPFASLTDAPSFCTTTGGTCNSSFNGRTHSFHKSRRIKARLTKKARGSKDRHLAEVAARKEGSKRQQKRRERDQKLKEKEEERAEASMEVDGQSKKKSADEKLGLALKKVGAGKKKYRKFLGQKSPLKKDLDRMEL